MAEISIIVPVYNVERYLRECLESIRTQTFEDWECIVVDDESPDGSWSIIEEYVKRDGRFKAVRRKNGGLSAARNSGLEVAQGRYIGFVDSDDWVDSGMYEELHGLIKEHDADMSQVFFFKEYRGISHEKRLVDEVSVLNRREVIREIYRDKVLHSYMWNKLFRREVITEGFPVGKVFEDIQTLSHWADNIEKCVLSPKSMYHYRYRRGSIAHSNSPSYRLQYLEACVVRDGLFERIEPGFMSREERDRTLCSSLLSCAKVIGRMSNTPKDERMAMFKRIEREYLPYISDISKKNLGRKMYKRLRMMLDRPKFFVAKLMFEKRLDFHSRYRTSRAYK